VEAFKYSEILKLEALLFLYGGRCGLIMSHQFDMVTLEMAVLHNNKA
jgi:hypothetical protein